MPSLPFSLLVPGPTGHQGAAVRDRVADSVAVVSALCYGAVMVRLGDATAPGAAIPWPADVAIGVLCAGALVVRRRWSLGVALALLPFGALSVMATGPILVALFTAAIRRRADLLLMLLGLAHVGTGIVYFLLQHDPPYPLWIDVAMRVLTGLAAIGWGQFLRAYRHLARSLHDRADRLVAEQQLRVEQARLTERARIAREMHDVLAHRMSMVSLHAGALEVRTDARPEEISVAAAAIRSSAHLALQELRTVIGVLRQGSAGPPEPPQPGLADLPDLLDSARTSGMSIDYTSRLAEGEPADEPPVLGRTAYRLVQEALTNAHKHAPGACVEIVLDGAAGRHLRILVVNQLHGGPPDDSETGRSGGWHGPLRPARAEPDAGRTPGAEKLPGAGTGLVGIGERVALAGGRVEYGTEQDRFRLEAWLPWTT
jgi:signal transduction histidine kinase